MARFPLVQRAAIPDELQYVWERSAAGGDLPNILRTPANNVPLWRRHPRLGNGLWTQCGLDLPTRELAVSRAAILHDSATNGTSTSASAARRAFPTTASSRAPSLAHRRGVFVR